MNNSKKGFLINGLFFCGDIYVLFDCKETDVFKPTVGDWLPSIDGFEFKTTLIICKDGELRLPVFTSRRDIPPSLKAGRFVAKRNISQVISEAKRLNATVNAQKAA